MKSSAPIFFVIFIVTAIFAGMLVDVKAFGIATAFWVISFVSAIASLIAAVLNK